MKQCEPLKEPLKAPKECGPCPPGLRNRRRMPMGHVGIVVSEPIAGASDGAIEHIGSVVIRDGF